MKLAFYGFLTVLCFARFECEQRDCGCVRPPDLCKGSSCVPVVIKDLSSLDGCTIGLELFDGKILIPERRVYIQAPPIEEDPAYHFPFVPGDTICVAYKNVELTTACNGGKNVFLTCITAGNINAK